VCKSMLFYMNNIFAGVFMSRESRGKVIGDEQRRRVEALRAQRHFGPLVVPGATEAKIYADLSKINDIDVRRVIIEEINYFNNEPSLSGVCKIIASDHIKPNALNIIRFKIEDNPAYLDGKIYGNTDFSLRRNKDYSDITAEFRAKVSIYRAAFKNLKRLKYTIRHEIAHMWLKHPYRETPFDVGPFVEKGTLDDSVMSYQNAQNYERCVMPERKCEEMRGLSKDEVAAIGLQQSSSIGNAEKFSLRSKGRYVERAKGKEVSSDKLDGAGGANIVYAVGLLAATLGLYLYKKGYCSRGKPEDMGKKVMMLESL